MVGDVSNLVTASVALTAVSAGYIQFVVKRTFVQPGVRQRYAQPVALPANVQLVDVVGLFDYKINLTRTTGTPDSESPHGGGPQPATRWRDRLHRSVNAALVLLTSLMAFLSVRQSLAAPYAAALGGGSRRWVSGVDRVRADHRTTSP